MEEITPKTRTRKASQSDGPIREFSTDTTTSQVQLHKKSFLKRYYPALLVLLVIGMAGITGYLYKKNKALQNPEQVAQLEAKELAEKVGMLIVLPQDEIPTIATVSDPDALKNQAFFIDAKKGDKVLIYSRAKKAILYDPVQHKIITVAPLNLDDNKPAATSAVKAPSSITPAATTPAKATTTKTTP